ncbi:MAG: hypothetical protein AB1473_15755 [Thermodesulfobacteriota bacterium]
MSLSRLVFAPYESERDSEVHELFYEYPHKNFQLKFMGIAKEKMAEYLASTLARPDIQGIGLRDEGRMVGLVALQALPWMSEHFGLRMYAVPHLLARSDGPLVHARLLRYLIEERPDVDFLDCRVAVDDVHSAHALEICGFRYVGTEIYMGQLLEGLSPPKSHSEFEIGACTERERAQVLDIVTETHVHNRFVYDPFIPTSAANSLYRRLVAMCFEQEQFTVLVARSRNEVHGFIIAKLTPAFSSAVGMACGSLDFIGVRPKSRLRGLGIHLNRWALYHMALKGAQYVAVRTLASNYGAVSTCHRTDFRVTSSSLHFHRWIHRPTRGAAVSSHGQSPLGGMLTYAAAG